MEIIPGLHCLSGVGLGVNAYVWHPRPADRNGTAGTGLPGSEEPVVFDCGYPWQAATLFDSLAKLGCPVEQVRTVAVTHDDYDHTGALAELVSASGADVVAHRLEAESLESSFWREMPRRSNVHSFILRAVTGMAYAARPKQPVTVTRPVEDGEEIAGGWIAIHTPGHTPGNLSYWHPQTRVLMAGDALGSQIRGEIRAPIGNYSVDNEECAASVRKLAALRPDTICFGHGPEIVGRAYVSLDRLARSLS
jgi:glyoxylase-like metal-dependent hydrolase (beta-lactamase superfamily II)